LLFLQGYDYSTLTDALLHTKLMPPRMHSALIPRETFCAAGRWSEQKYSTGQRADGIWENDPGRHVAG
jgi:hypothetical protein